MEEPFMKGTGEIIKKAKSTRMLGTHQVQSFPLMPNALIEVWKVM
jgi:hypothetical protein